MAYFIKNLALNWLIKEFFLNQRTLGEVTRNIVDRVMIFLYIVYMVLDYNYCILYFATCKWPLALCCLIN